MLIKVYTLKYLKGRIRIPGEGDEHGAKTSEVQELFLDSEVYIFQVADSIAISPTHLKMFPKRKGHRLQTNFLCTQRRIRSKCS